MSKLSVEHITKTYIHDKERKVGISDLTFCVEDGQFYSLIGPSGCGKSTILKIISSILRQESGNVFYDGKPIEQALERGLISYVPQSSSLFPNKTVLENVVLPLRIIGRNDKDIVNEVVKVTKLTNFLDIFPNKLSGGMKQRVAIARALVTKPKIMLMDEPFASLDEILRESLNLELIKIKNNFESSIIFVTHNIEEAVFLSDKIGVMSQAPGKIITEIDIKFNETRTAGLRIKGDFFKNVIKVREAMKKVIE